MPATGNALGIAFCAALAVSLVGWRTVVTLLGIALVTFMVIGVSNVVDVMFS